MTPEAMTVEEVAAKVRMHPRVVSNKAQSGEWPAMLIGREWRFDWDELKEHFKALARQKTEARKQEAAAC